MRRRNGNGPDGRPPEGNEGKQAQKPVSGDDRPDDDGVGDAKPEETLPEVVVDDDRAPASGTNSRSVLGRGAEVPPVRVTGLGVQIKDGDNHKWIVRNLSFSARAGEVVGLAGPSGSGKTTVLMCLAGVAHHAEGEVHVAGTGRLPGQLSRPSELRKVGIVFQDYHLVQALNALDNVSLPLRLDGTRWKRAAPEAIHLLAWFGLSRAVFKYPSQLSGGEQQRVAIARAMVRQPAVLLADEPTAHLDAASTHLVAESLHELALYGTCVIVSSHDPRLLSRFEHVVDLGRR
ncbi:MAG: ATP-binding cassette domain-containing protein [Acidimicrobiales bacterium]